MQKSSIVPFPCSSYFSEAKAMDYEVIKTDFYSFEESELYLDRYGSTVEEPHNKHSVRFVTHFMSRHCEVISSQGLLFSLACSYV